VTHVKIPLLTSSSCLPQSISDTSESPRAPRGARNKNTINMDGGEGGGKDGGKGQKGTEIGGLLRIEHLVKWHEDEVLCVMGRGVAGGCS